MEPKTKTIKLSEIVFDEDIYPRKEHDPALVQKYADILDVIEARGNYVSIAADNTLLDGRHRHLAYLKNANGNDPDINVFWYDITSKKEKFDLAVEFNSEHGEQLTDEDKKRCVIKFYTQFDYTLKDAAKKAKTRYERALDWTKTIREEQERKENETIYYMWLGCYTNDEIGNVVELTKAAVGQRIEKLCKEEFPGTKLYKLSQFEIEIDNKGETKPDSFGWKPPIYNVWTFGKKTNQTSHHGNSEQRILENLLYLYTEPFDIVLDPFAGGGSTIDVCKRRLRRYWVSDRKPIVERENEIRQLDIVQELPPLHNRWSEVTLTYLDPPYWKQAEGKYSEDAEDLANMSLDEFNSALASVVNCIAEKQSKGIIALLMQPTQWNAPEREFTDHVVDMVNAANKFNLKLENRVSCPYATEQYNPQQVEWAKANKRLLVLTRELIIWRIIK